MISGNTIICFSGAFKGITYRQEAPVIPDHDWREMGTVILQFKQVVNLARRCQGQNDAASALRKGRIFQTYPFLDKYDERLCILLKSLQLPCPFARHA
jgi:hypothetical protein